VADRFDRFGPVCRNKAFGRLSDPYFPRGHLLAGKPNNMANDNYNSALHDELVRCCGFSTTLASNYTSHGGRAGAASALKRAKVDKDVINERAGVKSYTWLEGYDRIDLDRRLDAARHLLV
jgi:hypothetical protein